MLGRTVTLVDYRGELALGIAREPQKALATVAAFREAWRHERDALAVMSRPMYRDLAASGLPMSVIAEDAARVAVRRP